MPTECVEFSGSVCRVNLKRATPRPVLVKVFTEDGTILVPKQVHFGLTHVTVKFDAPVAASLSVTY